MLLLANYMLFIFACLHGKDSCRGRNTGGEDRTNEQTLYTCSGDAEIVGHVPYNLAPRMSAFFMRENEAFARNHKSQSLQGSWLWSGSPMCLPSLSSVNDIHASYQLPGLEIVTA